MGDAMLDIRNLNKKFGGLAIFSDLNLQVGKGELRCIIGPNGAGKTTLFNLITGRLRSDSGEIRFEDRDICRLPVNEIARLGIGRKFQAPSVFEEMTVWNNLMVAGTGHRRAHRLFSTKTDAGLAARAERVLESVRLTARRDDLAGSLSHGQKQWLEIGIVMLNDPRLVLLDEPTAGMTVSETAETADLIQEVFRDRTAIIIEHDISFVRRLDSRVTVLNRGGVMKEGSFDEIAADAAVRKAYLGEEA
ncbi:ABC transporter ATP-binding protein [Hypericibacter terrae]|uniref:ABC transporter ATP-binding protein n=1 Tax=Hypericibacter terrae TaxID=2602015 RepID=A0A5J6MPN1_9PROT|nr:ATP-binding cassette domain-containing protein [Hypericibacter terrae]QEX19091.1 ABC transporter ATP-binding protein [Hypericibacter terrae]